MPTRTQLGAPNILALVIYDNDLAADGDDNDDDFKSVSEAVKTLQVLGRTSSLIARAPSSVRSEPLPDRSDDESW